ncbi:MAG: sugar kinase [Clostridia bacterium]|nr:sugar kinase [Clostridia bacterium]
MGKVITFGEIMMRLNPPGYLRFLQTETFDATYGGGEANVAVSLVNYGNEAAFVSKVPDHEIGQNAINALRRYGVDTSMVLRGGPRLGIYFCEKGASQRGSKVVYDRAGSSIALAKRDEFDWDKIFEGADWFHFTGITPALGGEMPEICLDACKAAHEKGLMVSCDLNYRGKLWSREKAGEVMGKLMPFVDVCIANEEDAKDVFGIAAENTDIEGGKLDREGYISVARQLTERFNFKAVAITLRGSISASQNNWSGMLYVNGQAYFAKNYLIQLVDRVGGGDSFGGGLIHALRKWPEDWQKAIEFAVAASCLKQATEYDFNLASEKEVLSLAGGSGSGRVQR